MESRYWWGSYCTSPGKKEVLTWQGLWLWRWNMWTHSRKIVKLLLHQLRWVKEQEESRVNFFFHLSTWVDGSLACNRREEEEKLKENRFIDLMCKGWETLYVMVSIFSIDDNPDEIFVAEEIVLKNNWLPFKDLKYFLAYTFSLTIFPETLLEFLLPSAPS